MASREPLDRLTLRAFSVADDLGFVALADLASLLSNNNVSQYRIIGGHMMTALVARWQLGQELYRETNDADIGMSPAVITDNEIVERLLGLGYKRLAGNRFGKSLTDIPLELVGERNATHNAIIDVLVPAYTSHARANHKVSDELTTTEVPGLATALRRPPIEMTIELHRLNKSIGEHKLVFPDEVSALILKTRAARIRSKATDIVDIWRCLEVAYAAGVTPESFEADNETLSIIRDLFADVSGPGMSAISEAQRLSQQAQSQQYVRIKALITQVCGNEQSHLKRRIIEP